MPVDSDILRDMPRLSSANTYWDIEGLKRLLNDRQKLWPSENATDDDDALLNERALKRGRQVFRAGQDARICSRQSSRRTMIDTPVVYAERFGSREVDSIRQSVSAPRFTHNQAYHDILRGSSAYSGKYGEHDQVGTGVEYRSGTSRRPSTSHPNYFYNHPKHLSSIDPEVRSSVLESEMRWVEAYRPVPLYGRPAGLDEDEAEYIQSLDDAHNEVIFFDDPRNISQQHLKENINGHGRESVFGNLTRKRRSPTAWPHRVSNDKDRLPRLLKHELVDEGQRTIQYSPHFVRTSLPEHSSSSLLQPRSTEPHRFIDEGQTWLIGEPPHNVRPPLLEQEPRLLGAYGYIGKRQPRAINDSPHFVRPPLPATLSPIHPGEEIRLRDPRPGIPRELPPTDGKMAGFWRVNKLY